MYQLETMKKGIAKCAEESFMFPHLLVNINVQEEMLGVEILRLVPLVVQKNIILSSIGEKKKSIGVKND